MSDDPSERTGEVERAFRGLLGRSGMVLESLDATTASRVALEFFRDVRFTEGGLARDQASLFAEDSE